MNIEIQHITEEFNKKLKTINLERIQIYQRLMQYRRKLYAYEKAKENNENNFESLNPNERYTKMVQSFLGSPNLTIEECLPILENETKEVSDLVENYRNAIKEYYSENNLPVYTVRGTKHETIKRSINIVNQYEAERGDWVFATSTEKGKNAYRIRRKIGMYGLGEDTNIYFGDVVEPKNGRLLLTEPAYYYTLKSNKFMPVVRITDTKDNPNDFHFEFGEEWTSDQDIMQEDIIDVEEYRDITDLLDNIQVISTTDEKTMQTFFASIGETSYRLKEIAKQHIQTGTCIYWNLVFNRNVNDYFKPVFNRCEPPEEKKSKEPEIN